MFCSFWCEVGRGKMYFGTKMSLKLMQILFDKGFNADTWLMVKGDERKVATHRFVLIAASEYFKTMLSVKVEKEKVICMNADTFPRFEVLEIVIHFLYCSEIDVGTFEEFKEVFVAWKSLKPFDMRWDALHDKIREVYDESDVLDFLDLIIHENPLSEVKDELIKFATENFLIIRAQPRFLKATNWILFKLLSADALNMENAEEGVLQTIKKWINHNYAERNRYFPELLLCLRYDPGVISIGFLVDTVWKICNCIESKRILIEFLMLFKGLVLERGQLITTKRTYLGF